MKKIISIIATMLIAGFVVAEPDGTSFTIVNKTGTVSSAVSAKLSGYLDSIYIDVTSGTTGMLSGKITSTGEIIYTNSTAITADTTVRPRVQVQDKNGVNLGSATNGYERVLLVEETLTFSQAEYGPVTNTYTIKLRLQKD